MSCRTLLLSGVVAILAALPLAAQQKQPAWNELPPPIDKYFERRVAEIAKVDWQREITPENWPTVQAEMRVKLRGMLGLNPWPRREDLRPEITGKVEGKGYIIEKLHFQSLPGLYVTANLYRPTEVKQPLPTILYVCGHSDMRDGQVRLGNKTGYQHHGIWFARHGYVCLILDTIQLGEIGGVHHGTYNQGRWWWVSRGYTPAGVEAWNGIRALDYLETRKEVDAKRIGMTGRSGGGAYTWWVAALDDRIKAAVPVAGIASLKNHVLDGTVEGHCDCMFMLNTERWDFDRVASLVAPRALLISNTDKDNIFPLDGVVDVHRSTAALYRKLGKEANLGLHIAEGPHKDMQPLNIAAFHWFDRHLKGKDLLDQIEESAKPGHPPRELKVFDKLPADEKVTTIDETFVPKFEAAKEPPETKEAWEQLRDGWMQALRDDTFRAWPKHKPSARPEKKLQRTVDAIQLARYEIASEEGVTLPLWVLQNEGTKLENAKQLRLTILDEETWAQFRNLAAVGFASEFPNAEMDVARYADLRNGLTTDGLASAYFCPRGVGPAGWSHLPKEKQTQILRRFNLVGESLESGRVWDAAQAIAAVKQIPGADKPPLVVTARSSMAANALYASLYISGVARLELNELPTSHAKGPVYLNVLRIADLPQAAAMAAERAEIVLSGADSESLGYAQGIARLLKLGDDRVRLSADKTSAKAKP